MHEIVSLHIGIDDIGELNGAGIVDDNIYAAEPVRRLGECVSDQVSSRTSTDIGSAFAAVRARSRRRRNK